MPRQGKKYGDATPALDDIVTAALRLLDEGGRPGLTIAKLAKDLGSYPANLYRRFADIDELMGHVAARVFDELGGGPNPDLDPETALLDFAMRCRAGWLAHPKAITLLFLGEQNSLAETLEVIVTEFRKIATSDERLVAALYEYTLVIYGAIFLGAAQGWGYEYTPADPKTYPNTGYALSLLDEGDGPVVPPAAQDEPFRQAITRAIQHAISG